MRKRVASRAIRRVAVLTGLVALFALAIARLDLRPNFSRVRVAILSGSEGGNYHAIVGHLAAAARNQRGQIENVATQGSVDNIERLSAARQSCRAHFALVQDGLDWPPGLELTARLPRAESVFILGRAADRIRALVDLQRLRIGIGPEGSGTNLLARKILESPFLTGHQLTLTNHPLDEQLSRLQAGALDLGVFVIDEDAALI